MALALRSSSTHSYWVDILRGLAIISVIIVHTALAAKSISVTYKIDIPSYSDLFLFGRYGVELFFFISGLLISMIYGSKSRESFSAKNYWKKRILRIMPLWVLFLTITILRGYLFPQSPGNWGKILQLQADPGGIKYSTAAVIFMTITFTLWLVSELWNSVISGGWSIQSEMAHYVSFPIIRRLSLGKVLFYLSVINIIYLLLNAFQSHATGYLDFFTSALLRLSFNQTVFFFASGIVFYKFVLSPERKKRIAGITKIEIFLVFIYISTIIPFEIEVIQAAIFVMLFGVLGLLITKNRIFSTFFRTYGKYSYFIYFFHFFVIEFLVFVVTNLIAPELISELNFPEILFVLNLGTLVVVLPFGYLSYRYIEAPMISIGHKAVPKI